MFWLLWLFIKMTDHYSWTWAGVLEKNQPLTLKKVSNFNLIKSLAQAEFWKKNLSQSSTKSFSSLFINPSACILQNVAMVTHCIASFVTLPVDTDGYYVENSIYCQNWKVDQRSIMNLNICLSTNFEIYFEIYIENCFFSIKKCLYSLTQRVTLQGRWVDTSEVKSQPTTEVDLRFDLSFWLKFFSRTPSLVLSQSLKWKV